MKYQLNLPQHINVREWKKHRQNIPRTEYSSLNDDEKAWLQAFNDSLRELEDKYLAIFSAKYKELQARVDDSNDWLMCFYLEYELTFFLREDDPEFKDDDDNVLMKIIDLYFEDKQQNWFWGTCDVENHPESIFLFPEEKKHCNLFYELYERCHLDWRDFFRIDCMHMDIKIEEQSGSLPINKIL